MKSYFGVLLLAVLVATGGSAADEPRHAMVPSEIPEVLYETSEPDQPVFYRFEGLEQADGSIDLEKLSHSVRRHMELPQKATADCHQILPPIRDYLVGYRSSLTQALQTSHWVVVAEVRATAEGVLARRRVPGTLLQVIPSEILKGPSLNGMQHVFMPIAKFHLNGQCFTIKDPAHAPLPEIGDRVLLLVDVHVSNFGAILSTGSYTGIITLPRDGAVGLPKRYEESDPSLIGLSPEEFLAWVHRALAEGGSQ